MNKFNLILKFYKLSSTYYSFSFFKFLNMLLTEFFHYSSEDMVSVNIFPLFSHFRCLIPELAVEFSSWLQGATRLYNCAVWI